MAMVASLFVRIGADISDFRKKMEQVKTGLRTSLGDEALGLSQGLLGGLAAVGAGMGVLGGSAIKMAADMEQSQIAFTTLLGSADKAQKFLADLSSFAARTPFEMPGLQDASRKLLAFGFQADQIIPMMTSIGDAVAALGGGAAEIDRVTYALGQMQAKGKVSAEEMGQLAELGIPVWQMLADKIGVDIPTAMKMAENGAIDATTGINAVLEGMNKRFGGAMEKQSTTLNGMWSTFKDNLGQTLTAIGFSLVETFDLKNKLSGALEWMTQFTNIVKGQGLAEAIKQMFPPEVKITVVAIAGAIAGALVPALASMAVAAWAALSPLLPFIAAGAALALLAYYIWENWQPIKKWFIDLWTSITSTVTALWNTIKGNAITIWNSISAYFKGAFDNLMTIVSGAWEIIKSYFAAAFLTLYYLVTGQWGKIGEVWRAFAEKAKGIVGDMWKRVYDNTSQMISSVVGVIGEMPGRVIAWFQDLKNRVYQKWQEMKSDAYNMGRNIIQGLIDGVVGMATALVNRVRGVVSNAVQAAKNLLGIHSPSRVFMEIGGYTSQGFALGIQDNLAAVRSAISSMTNSAVRTAASAPGLQATGGGAAIASGPVIQIENLYVRSDEDVRLISRELYNLHRSASRAKGLS